MRSRIFGGLCCVTFCISALAYIPGQGADLERKDPTSSPVDNQAVEQHQALKGQIQEKATKMVAVTSRGCDPCRQMKAYTIPALQLQGYDATSIDFKSWEGPAVDMVPALFYMDEVGNIIHMEVGFRTPKQVKQYLGKIDK